MQSPACQALVLNFPTESTHYTPFSKHHNEKTMLVGHFGSEDLEPVVNVGGHSIPHWQSTCFHKD
ncbi:hypothetical protein NSPZN2_100484 [Nitrospira defluvii]|uniref:Uncharacterized protein n=1 Tax=Nitrospira defluvii TaxID=330214 RepID=A0ABM8R5F9_9BACT|nr:hypothetical protein NSPZN2_100484 [Nitrospira defluvii]